MTGPKAPQPQDGIYRAILIVLVISVVAGVAITLVGEYWLQARSVSRAGAWFAMVSAVIYFFFRWLGRRESRRAQDRGPDDDRTDSAGRDP